jgi:hypothetical protein
MTETEILLKMQYTLERMLESEDIKHHQNIKFAHGLITSELLRPNPKIFNTNLSKLVTMLLGEVFIEKGLAPFEFERKE